MTLSENYYVLQKWPTYVRMLGVATTKSYEKKLKIWCSHHCKKRSAFLISQKASQKDLDLRNAQGIFDPTKIGSYFCSDVIFMEKIWPKNVQNPYKNQCFKSCYYLRKCWWFFHSYISYFCGHDICVVKISDYFHNFLWSYEVKKSPKKVKKWKKCGPTCSDMTYE